MSCFNGITKAWWHFAGRNKSTTALRFLVRVEVHGADSDTDVSVASSSAAAAEAISHPRCFVMSQESAAVIGTSLLRIL